MKSICIKTNNSDLIQYLLNELNDLELEQVYFSCRKFKHYNNIIIHYKGLDNNLFLNKICSILSLLILDELEETFLKKIILQNYFYFDNAEREQILNLCFDIMANDFSIIFDKKFKSLSNSFYDFLYYNKSLVLNGYINFRIKSYLEILDDIVNEAVNNFIIEKEYLEFVSLLKLYINSQESNCKIVHIIYSNSESILLDENKEIISISNEKFKAKYLSDITFSSNDYTLNSLLSLLPKKIYIHLIDNNIDEFINTLQTVFENRIHICTDCNICKLYKNSIKSKSPNTIY